MLLNRRFNKSEPSRSIRRSQYAPHVAYGCASNFEDLPHIRCGACAHFAGRLLELETSMPQDDYFRSSVLQGLHGYFNAMEEK